jgi:hypothetical protein
MTRKQKSLGVAFIAVLGMSTAVASAAHATNTNIHTAKPNATITAAGPQAGVVNVFTATNGLGKNLNTRCEGPNKFRGALAGGATTSETLTLNGEYKECNIAGSEATISMNDCAFLFHSNSPTLTTASVDIICEGSNEITATSAAGCTIHIPGQTGKTTTTLTNTGTVGSETRDIDANINVTGIKYTVTAGCPNTTSPLTTTDGVYKEEVTITAEPAGGGSVGIFWD